MKTGNKPRKNGRRIKLSFSQEAELDKKIQI
jgi:hypothetical protein